MLQTRCGTKRFLHYMHTLSVLYSYHHYYLQLQQFNTIKSLSNKPTMHMTANFC